MSSSLPPSTARSANANFPRETKSSFLSSSVSSSSSSPHSSSAKERSLLDQTRRDLEARRLELLELLRQTTIALGETAGTPELMEQQRQAQLQRGIEARREEAAAVWVTGKYPDDEDCYICMEPYTDKAGGKEKWVVSPCRHSACFMCLKHWRKLNKAKGGKVTCPKCRGPVKDQRRALDSDKW